MPQLMPLNWCVSFLMVNLLFIVLLLIYFMSVGNYENSQLKNFNYNLNWKW